MIVHVAFGQTESGDTVGPAVFAKAPKEEQLRALCEFVEGEDEGPGMFGSFTHLTVVKREVQ